MIPLLQLPPWALMWILALAFYAAAKSATLLAADLRAVPAHRKLAYLFLFPGMNAATFFTPRPAPARPILPYIHNMLLGTAFLWILPTLLPGHPLLQGWSGMIGLILLLHFGILQLLARACQAAGFHAPLLMDHPLRSASVTEFWSRRWNTGFRQLSHQFLFQPLARHTGPRAAMLLTFALSGVLHDLVISLPARGGFGLPTAYFLLQGAALHFEHTRTGRRALRRPFAARALAIAIVAFPAPLLFHTAFVTRVILPFMAALHALPKEALS